MKDLRASILEPVRPYYPDQFSSHAFVPGKDLVHYGGQAFDAEALCNLVDASLDFYLTANRYAVRFERDFAAYRNVSTALLVNSGATANLVAVAALTSSDLGARRRENFQKSIGSRHAIYSVTNSCANLPVATFRTG
jgi:CDP-6-deoxy-D-xylo-4-hexulose-3-dehydrase